MSNKYRNPVARASLGDQRGDPKFVFARPHGDPLSWRPIPTTATQRRKAREIAARAGSAGLGASG